MGKIVPNEKPDDQNTPENTNIMEEKYTDNDVLVDFMNHTNYINKECGVHPMYTHVYQPTVDELSEVPQSPILNWYMY